MLAISLNFSKTFADWLTSWAFRRNCDKVVGMSIKEALERAEIFLGLDNADLAKIASLRSCHEADCQAGQIIFKAGERARYIYILKEGQVDLVSGIPSPASQKPELIVERVTTGSLFGWSALVEPHYYALSGVCKEPSKMVAIDGTELLELFAKDHRLGYEVFQSLARIIGTRVRVVEQFLVLGKRWPFLERASP